VQMGLFTTLIWIPAIASGKRDWETWSETIVSCALTAGGWVIAETYRRKFDAAHIRTDVRVH
jgi:hypothetical protein